MKPKAEENIADTRAVIGMRTMELIVLGERQSAQALLQWGLVNRVVAHADMLATAMDLASQVATRSGHATARFKRLLTTQLQSQLRQSAGQFVFWKNNVAYYQNTALPNAKSIVQNASRGYQSGDIGYLEYATALQTNLEIQRAYLEEINSLNQSVISIQFLINQ